ncbi:hypothetical protein MMMIC1C10_00360 [Methanococcus maripaludis]|uniref:class III signal peptide-containing protein n=1 Tax=Methanococcus maripaludis TaxID=39152 RepID=UPI00314186B8
MKFLEKLTSKKGQVSMEIGILVAAAVAVAAIAAYYYASNVKNSSNAASANANNVTTTFGNLANGTSDDIAALAP